MKKRVLFLVGFLLAMKLFAVDFHVTVIDSEIELPLEGVVLTLTNKSAGPWETDFNGECTVTIEDFSSAVVLQAYLPGYAIKKIRLTPDQTEVEINLSIEEIMEGKELVVEKEAYKRADAESGISVALAKDQIQTTSLIGIIPDVMSAVKTLPGVAYAGSFCQQPSIRGSYPFETACVLDGMYVLQPYHWSGAVSIFDPLMVESVKLSHGIFSAQYGHATAALLDVNSVNPIGDSVKVNASVSSIQTDVYAQIPVTKTFGTVAGMRMTYMNTVPWLYDHLGITKWASKKYFGGQLGKIGDYIRMPYMYDYYLKAFYNPCDRFALAANGFLGLEGLGAHLNIDTDEDETTTPSPSEKYLYDYYFRDYYSHTNADWANKFGFGALNMKWLPTDNLQFVAEGAYNIYKNEIAVVIDQRDYYKRSLPTYDWNNGADRLRWNEYEDITYLKYTDGYYIELYQGKLGSNFQLDSLNLFSLGAEELYQKKTFEHELQWDFVFTGREWWDGEEIPPLPERDPDSKYDKKTSNPGNDILNTVGYTFWEFGNDTSLLKGELGLRFEHYLVNRDTDKSKVSTNPYFNPRFSIQYTPVRNTDYIDTLKFSAGSGVFTKMSDETMDLGKEYKISKDNIKPDRNIFGLIGTEIDFSGSKIGLLDNLSFQTEAYYKYYTNRFYAVSTPTEKKDENGEIVYEYSAFADGTAHVAGLDCMLHKKTGRHLDGYLTYSWIFARYRNPSGYDKDVVRRTTAGDPLGIWYWPYFHRFHTFNAVINYRPVTAITWTVSGGVTSGNPKEYVNLNGLFGDGEKVYNDKQRNPAVYPVNLRLAFSNYAFTTKVKWELYMGVENLLGFANKTSLLGALIHDEDLDLSNVANFDTGIPSLSVGFRLSY